eukprot:snap_masked-scaffold_10-processed-gene-7.23-mRNA-1 protein AED:1.00 eAED:1.00 QI:0/0/0/0/1/1/2/0/65
MENFLYYLVRYEKKNFSFLFIKNYFILYTFDSIRNVSASGTSYLTYNPVTSAKAQDVGKIEFKEC